MDVVLGLVPAIALAAVVLAWFTMWWFVLPRVRPQVQAGSAARFRPIRYLPKGIWCAGAQLCGREPEGFLPFALPEQLSPGAPYSFR